MMWPPRTLNWSGPRPNAAFSMCGGVDVIASDERLSRAISYLLPKDREIGLLSYFTELTDEEVVQRVKLSRSTVQRRRTAALDKLREMLGRDV